MSKVSDEKIAEFKRLIAYGNADKITADDIEDLIAALEKNWAELLAARKVIESYRNVIRDHFYNCDRTGTLEAYDKLVKDV